MTIFATVVAIACMGWSVLSFCAACIHAATGNAARANQCEGGSVAWLVAGGIFFLVAK